MLKKYVILLIVLLAVLTGMTAPAIMADDSLLSSHEDPNTAEQIFSGISLLHYYSISLDFIIQKDQVGSEAKLSKMPFANVPAQIEETTADFASYGKEFTESMVELYDLWNKQNEFIKQYRLSEAADLYQEIKTKLPITRQELSLVEVAVIATGEYLKMDAVPLRSELKLSYDEVLAKIQQLYQMLDLLSRPLLPELLLGLLPSTNPSLTPEQLAELLRSANPDLTPEQVAELTPEQLSELLKSLTPEQLAELLSPTELTMEIDPTTAYVGEKVSFRGVLSTSGIPLAEREVTFLLNSADLLTVQTDTQGHYQGAFQLPYRYVHEASVQTIFYPQSNDAGVYLAATSSVLQITVLFYEAQLTLTQDSPAYPGREAVIQGYFDYGEAPPLAQRQAELYLDDALQNNFTVETTFTQQVKLAAETTSGKHTITVSAPALGRYAPVFTNCILDVTRALPIMDLNAPRISIIPGSIGFSGKLYSELGPLENASVAIAIGKNEIQVTTVEDGSFDTQIKMGMGLSLLGTQTVEIQVQPQEPWNAPLSTTKNILLINVVNCGIILIVLVFFGIYLPRRFKKWFGISPKGKVRPSEVVLPVTTEINQVDDSTYPRAKDNRDAQEEAANPILYWYRLALKLVQNITKFILKPQQTLREYARDVSRVLGPAGKYFMELTYIIEKRLYARWQPSPQDIERSKELSRTLQEENKGENN